MAHENEAVMRRGYEAFAQRDLGTLKELLADDVVWHVPGDNPLSGTYRGQQEVFGMFGRIAELNDAFSQELHDVLANDDHVVALVNQTMERAGRTLTGHVVHVAHIEDGELTTFWAYNEDQPAVDAMYED